MKHIILAISFMVITTTAKAEWIASPNYAKGYCEAHQAERTVEFGIAVIPVGPGKISLLAVFGSGTSTMMPASIEFGPNTYGPYPVGHFVAWSQHGLIGALAKAEDDKMSIIVHKGEDAHWFDMTGFKNSIRQCVSLMVNAKGA